jgi:hypothetical protein
MVGSSSVLYGLAAYLSDGDLALPFDTCSRSAARFAHVISPRDYAPEVEQKRFLFNRVLLGRLRWLGADIACPDIGR